MSDVEQFHVLNATIANNHKLTNIFILFTNVSICAFLLFAVISAMIDIQYWNRCIDSRKCIIKHSEIYPISAVNIRFDIFALYELENIFTYRSAKSSDNENYLIEAMNTDYAIGTSHNCYYDSCKKYILFSNDFYTDAVKVYYIFLIISILYVICQCIIAASL